MQQRRPPVQGAVLVNLLETLAGCRETPERIVKICDTDPSLAAWLFESCAHQANKRRIPSTVEALKQVRVSSLKTLAVQEAARLLDQASPSPDREAAWQRALHCACLCRLFAQALSYSASDEAYLAGLLHNLGQQNPLRDGTGIPDTDSDVAWAETVEAWQYQSFIADALRYQRWPGDSLRDASTLVQILWAARNLVEDSDSNGHLPTLLDMTREQIAELHARAGAEAEALHEELCQFQGQAGQDAGNARLVRALSRFSALEHLVDTLSVCDHPDQAVSAIARHMTEVHGLTHPLYFVSDAEHRKLISHPVNGLGQLDLMVPIEASNAALARAYRTGEPVLTWHGTGEDRPSLLDEQIARLALADGVIAIPLGAPDAVQGVLIACGSQPLLSWLHEDVGYLSQIGVLFGQRLPYLPAPAETDSESQSPLSQWRSHTRRLAHEINNPLGIIKNYLALMRLKMGDTNAAQDDLRVINEELDRISGIVQSLVHEGNAALQSCSEIDINGLLGDLVKVVSPGLMSTKQIEMRLDLDPQLPRVVADRDKLKQLLINLILNAIEASPDQGHVLLETHHLVDHNQTRLVEMRVSNTGAPITPERMATLFEPVQTEKGGTHAGLGLSIVRTLASDLQAKVACRSQAQLTTFQVLIPVAQA